MGGSGILGAFKMKLFVQKSATTGIVSESSVFYLSVVLDPPLKSIDKSR